MTADIDQRSGELPEGPLETLRRRIESARRLRPLQETAEVDSSDPLEALRRRVESASDLEVRAERSAAAGPLGQLLATIDRARRATARGTVELEELEEPSTAAGDSLQRLHRRIRTEIEALGARTAVDLSPRTGQTPRDGTAPEAPATGGVEARIGREVLEMLADRELSGSVRVDAVRRLAEAVDDPDSDQIRDVLRLLIAPGETDAPDG